jgi:hypothetical protein
MISEELKHMEETMFQLAGFTVMVAPLVEQRMLLYMLKLEMLLERGMAQPPSTYPI